MIRRRVALDGQVRAADLVFTAYNGVNVGAVSNRMWRGPTVPRKPGHHAPARAGGAGTARDAKLTLTQYVCDALMLG